MNSTRVAFFTTEYSPFQVELARAINEADRGIKYDVWFLNNNHSRPQHWRSTEGTETDAVRTAPSRTSDKELWPWIMKEMDKFSPAVVISGGVRGLPMKATRIVRSDVASCSYAGAWLEQPLPTKNVLKKAAKHVSYKMALSPLDFVLAIGDRALSYYRRCNSNSHFVPYGSDLEPCFELSDRRLKSDKLRILFSGGLVERHDFPLIMESLRDLHKQVGDRFEFVVSGHGPEEATITKYLEAYPPLKSAVRYHRTFQNWNDRLLPFAENDVLLYTTKHAGWGLVVPEAMASGMPVVASEFAEAGRFLVDHEVNGLLVNRSRRLRLTLSLIHI